MTIMLRQGQSKGYIELLCHLISNLGELARKQNGSENRFNSLETRDKNAMQCKMSWALNKKHTYGPI